MGNQVQPTGITNKPSFDPDISTRKKEKLHTQLNFQKLNILNSDDQDNNFALSARNKKSNPQLKKFQSEVQTIKKENVDDVDVFRSSQPTSSLSTAPNVDPNTLTKEYSSPNHQTITKPKKSPLINKPFGSNKNPEKEKKAVTFHSEVNLPMENKEKSNTSNNILNNEVLKDEKDDVPAKKHLTQNFSKSQNNRLSTMKADNNIVNQLKDDMKSTENVRGDKRRATEIEGNSSKKKLNEMYGVKNDQKLLADISKFKFINIIETSDFGKVLLAKNLQDEELYAVKCIKKSFLGKDKKNLENLKLEKKLYEKINHPFVTTLKCHFQTADNMYLVLSYCSGGDLFTLLAKSGKLDENLVKQYAAQIYLALNYLHSKGIIYRDIKPENIAIDKKGNIQLIDMNLAKEGISSVNLTKTVCGTNEYVPPEVIKGNKYGFNFDWWGYGILLFELLNGFPPFTDKDKAVLFQKILLNEPDIDELKVSKECKDFLGKLLLKDLEKRIKPELIPAHPWLKKLNFKDIEDLKVTSLFIPTVVSEKELTNTNPEFMTEIDSTVKI